MALAVAQLGWLLGAITMMVMLAMNVHISILLWRAKMMCPDSANTVAQLTLAAFAAFPEPERRLRVWFVEGTQQLYIFVLLGLYVLSLGKSLGMFFYDFPVCLPIWAFIGSLGLLPLHTSSRTMGTWKTLIAVNCLTILATILIPLVYMASVGVKETRVAGSTYEPVVTGLAPSNFLESLSLYAFAFTGQLILVEIMSEMADVEEFPKAYSLLAAPFQAVAFLLVGVGGYYFIGSDVSGLINSNMPFGGWFRVTAACLMMHMVITYLIKAIVFCRSIHSHLDKDAIGDNSSWSWVVWGTIGVCTIAVSWLVSQVIPFFSDLVDLLGASLTPITCWVVPIWLYLRCVKDKDGKLYSVGTAEMCVISLELLFSFVLVFAGTRAALIKIYQHWETYGGPLSCHCENLWNTCACSGSHAGMEMCPASAVSSVSLLGN